jgi:hypothetical protein
MVSQTQQITGKLILRYIGPNGKHTELWINNEHIASGFNCNKSIMFLLWCACDISNKDISNFLKSDFKYEKTKLGTWICKNIFKRALFSKFDIISQKNAPANTYKSLIYKQNYLDPINVVLSARRDLFLHVQKKFNLTSLEVIYELNDREIFAY